MFVYSAAMFTRPKSSFEYISTPSQSPNFNCAESTHDELISLATIAMKNSGTKRWDIIIEHRQRKCVNSLKMQLARMSTASTCVVGLSSCLSGFNPTPRLTVWCFLVPWRGMLPVNRSSQRSQFVCVVFT